MKPKRKAARPDHSELDAFSVAQFCRRHGIARATFYKLQAQRRAPRVMKVGSRTLISREAAAAWRAAREAEGAKVI